jgi:hypothetical protein
VRIPHLTIVPSEVDVVRKAEIAGTSPNRMQLTHDGHSAPATFGYVAASKLVVANPIIDGNHEATAACNGGFDQIGRVLTVQLDLFTLIRFWDW